MPENDPLHPLNNNNFYLALRLDNENALILEEKLNFSKFFRFKIIILFRLYLILNKSKYYGNVKKRDHNRHFIYSKI